MKTKKIRMKTVQTNSKEWVVYDKKTGEIVHGHKVTIFEGAKMPKDIDIEATALESGSKNSDMSKSALSLLRVKPEEMKVGTEYKVDIKEKRLIKVGRKEV